MDERQWIKAVRRGDKRYFSDIAEKYYDDIFRFCAYQTGSRDDACDLAQETFLRFIRYAESYRSRNLKGYLLTIAMNLCRDHCRAGGRREEVCGAEAEDFAPEDSPAGGGLMPEERALEGERWRLLREALRELPDMQREAIVLHYFQDMKYREIGRLTGVSLSTVKSRIRQGTERLARLLRREDFFDE